eukprot:c20852_g1_i1.p1 GENE.c20852_g1_i1~~c20852_g1_i1.p1  ORF type:complete len:431 (+),score=126.48 c20852_g1_i1:1-1293(+)
MGTLERFPEQLVVMSFLDLSKPEGLAIFDEYIASKLYIQGYLPTSLDQQAFQLLGKGPDARYTHAARYFEHMKAFTDDARAHFRQGGDVPDQLAGSVAAPAVTSAKSAPAKKGSKVAADAVAPAATPAPSGDAAELQAKRDAQAEKIRKLKADGASKDDVSKEVDVLKAIDAALKGSQPAAAADDKKGKKEKGKGKEGKEDKPKEDKPKEDKPKDEGKKGKGDKADKGEKAAEKPKGDKPKGGDKVAGFEEYDTKLVKAVEKEGGKTGQDIIGVHEMGGLEFFCTTVSTPDGDLKLTELCMFNMNKEVDPEGEERRGGSGPVGKMIFSAGTQQLSLVAYVPQDKQAKVNATEWAQAVLAQLGGELAGTPSAGLASGIVKSDPAKGKYSIKLKDDGIAHGVAYLKERGCFPDTKEDSESDMVFGDDDFIMD